MKAGWEVKPLGEVCELIKRGIAPKYIESGGVRVLNQKCIRGHTINYDLARRNDPERKRVPDERLIQVGDVLVNSTGTGTLGRVAQVRADPDEPTTVDTHVTIVRPLPGLFYPDFFGYMMIMIEDALIAGGQGASGQTELPRAELEKSYFVKNPPTIEEQRRIVAVLDEAFEGLDRARKNTETNLTNTRELFRVASDKTLLVEGQGGTVQQLIGEVKTGPFGSLLHKSDYIEGGIPLINPSHIVNGKISPDFRKTVSEETRGRLSSYVVRRDDIVIGRRGEMGRCAKVTEKEEGWLCGTGSFFIRPYSSVNSDFVVRKLRSQSTVKQLEAIAGGAVMPNLSNRALSDLNIQLPALEYQESVLDDLLALEVEHIRLEQHYHSRVANLEDLRQSILQKAFAGELTASTVHPVVAPANDNMSPQFAAYILAYAYNAHAGEAREIYFGRVKAQKTLHLAEALSGIDLGRDPIKDRAGPNDMPHMTRAEDWARDQKFFYFEKRSGGGYSFIRMSNFDAFLLEAEDQLEPIGATLEHILGVLVDLDSKEAEAVATTYAAWNNFIIDGIEATDAQIARAASIDWHPDKRLTEEQCLTALATLRSEEMIPDGSAKYVGTQPNLL